MTIFHLLLLVLAFSTESMAAPGSCGSQTVQYNEFWFASSQTTQYDELLLVLQWPTSYCNTGLITCNFIPLKFTVHGLWLNRNSAGVDCNEDRKIMLDLQKNSLWKDMVDDWPNLRSPEHPEDFWIHEYRKHGHCFEDFYKQEDYFRTALNIKKAIGDVMKMQLSTGEILRRGNLYHVRDFQYVTIAGQKLIPQLRCNMGEDKKYPQLHEIIFCSDRQKNLKNCTFDVDGCFKTRKDKGKIKRGSIKFP